jgi:hypothetical protein
MSENWKPLEELTLEELREKPIWIYDFDKTVRPTNLTVHPNPHIDQTTYIVLTTFELNDGTEMVGYCSPADSSGIDYIQPVIIHDGCHVPLWDEDNGHETKKGIIATRLSRSVNNIYPLKYSSNVICEGKCLEETIIAT